jgi:predicted PurR-regulated permease PerM
MILGGGALIYLFFRYLFLLVLPFLIAWGIAFMTRGIADRINKKTGFPRRALRVILALLTSLSLIGAVSLVTWLLAAELWRLLSGFGDGAGIRGLIERITDGGMFGSIFDAFGDRIADVFYEFAVSIASSLGQIVSGWLGAVPKIFLFILVTVIASAYFASDLDRINAFITRLLPKRVISWLSFFRRGFFCAGVGYVRSYLTLMALTFGIMLVGLMILGEEYSLLLAFIIAFADLLPVIGVGTVLIPWSIYEIAVGNNSRGVGLLVLFGVYEIVRQLLEPKIVGKSLGVHPLLSLVLIYLAYSLFGFGGILIVPIAIVLIKIWFGKKYSAEVEKL